jgi:CubicO group peptidase (beta-lactamase class C family)
MEQGRPERGSHEPGEHFYYNNWGFNAAGTIFRQLTGEDIFEPFEEEIAKPIGMEDFDASECLYHYEREDSEHPAYRFRMSARDMARFGVLYYQKGEWNGRRVIPSDWVEESTTTQTVASEEAGAGYGFMWGVMPEGTPAASMIGAAGYLHAGFAGHVLAVFPDDELVVARVDTDGDGPQPGEHASLKLINMILAAQVGE